MAHVISGKCPELIKAMNKAGILTNNCRRVVIDIEYNSFVKVYYEVLGDTRLIDVDFASHIGVMIKETKKGKGETG